MGTFLKSFDSVRISFVSANGRHRVISKFVRGRKRSQRSLLGLRPPRRSTYMSAGQFLQPDAIQTGGCIIVPPSPQIGDLAADKLMPRKKRLAHRRDHAEWK